MRAKQLSFETFRGKSVHDCDQYVIRTKDGGVRYLYPANTVWVFDDSKSRIDYWRFGRYDFVRFVDIVGISEEDF